MIFEFEIRRKRKMEEVKVEKKSWYERNADAIVTVGLVAIAYTFGMSRGIKLGTKSVGDAIVDICKLGVK